MAQATRIDPGYFGQDFEEFIEPTSLSRSETISTSRESHWPKPPVPGQSHYKLIFTMRLCYFWPFYGD